MTRLRKSPRSGAELRRSLLDEYELSSVPALTLVDVAAAALDEALAAERAVKKDGLTVRGARGGIVTHPLVFVGQQARQRLLKALRQLNLET